MKDLRAIEDAFVPVLKMKYDGVEIDMTFARLPCNGIPHSLEDDIDDEADMTEEEKALDLPTRAALRDIVHMKDLMTASMDPRCTRSLNGYKSTVELIRAVPNVRVFRAVLRYSRHRLIKPRLIKPTA